MFCVPAHLQRLFAHWDEVGVPDLSCFRLVAHAGAACPPPVKQRLLELFPPRTTWEFYGSTEGQFTACRSEEWSAHPGTVGRARPGRSLSVDGDGTIWCVVPEHARFSYWRARRRPPPAGATPTGAGVHGRGPRPARRRGLPVPRRPSGGPGHLRRRERLPGRGGERPRWPPGGAGRRGLRGRGRALGAAGVRGGGRGGDGRGAWRRTPPSGSPRPSARSPTSGSTPSPGPRRARSSG